MIRILNLALALSPTAAMGGPCLDTWRDNFVAPGKSLYNLTLIIQFASRTPQN